MKLSDLFRRKKDPKEINGEPNQPVVCSNCETTYSGNFCPHCGQSKKDFNQPFRILVYDFMGTMFAFDTRFFKTIKAVVTSPGKFSADYIEGKRMSYMPPFQFYVFISFVFFLLLSIHTGSIISETSNKLDKIQADSTVIDSTKLTQFKNELSNAIKTKQDSLANDVVLKNKKILTSKKGINLLQKAFTKQYNDPKTSPYKKRILRNAIRMMDYPEMFMSKVFRYLSWSMFILLPVFAFWLWAFFHKTRKYYLGHLIFSLESLSVTFLIFSVMFAVNLIFPQKTISPEVYLFWLIPVYIWLGLKKFYKRTFWNTSLKFIFLSGVYFITTAITASVVFLLSLYI